MEPAGVRIAVWRRQVVTQVVHRQLLRGDVLGRVVAVWHPAHQLTLAPKVLHRVGYIVAALHEVVVRELRLHEV